MANRLFTIGYEGLSIETFIRRIKSAGVETVLDVRATPISRKPGFSKTAFSAALKTAGIAYVHLPAMGCPKEVRDQYKIDNNWTTYTQKFLSYLNSQKETLIELVALTKRSPSCLVCFEADFAHCHRTYVARAAAKLGNLQVMHFTGQTKIAEGAVRSAA